MSTSAPGPIIGEMRIGLAMSGAIALVLYESGVAHEIHAFLNKKGDYLDALTRAQLKPVVDILTGASAGGINSVFLANCFVNGGEFEDFTDLWINNAGVDQLRYGSMDEAKSVLNIKELIRQMKTPLTRHIKQPDPALKQDEQIKVRLCRTDLRGYCVSTVDAIGHRIDVDSRSDVLAFDNHAFDDVNKLDEVIRAAAATSAFPIAFPPVFDKGRWYVDGGLWNNQPIDLAVEAIADKPAFGRTHRCVFFIDPNPAILASDEDPLASDAERLRDLQERSKEQFDLEPSALETVAFIPAMGIKGSILPALDSILGYNRRIELYQQLIDIDELGAAVPSVVVGLKRAKPDEPDKFKALSLLDQVRIENVLFDNDPALVQSWAAIREKRGELVDTLVAAATQVLASIEDIDIERRAIRRELFRINRLFAEAEKNRQAQADETVRSEDVEDLSPEGVRRAKTALYARLGVLNKVLYAPPSDTMDTVSPSLSYRQHRREHVSRFWPGSVRILEVAVKIQNGTLLRSDLDKVLPLWTPVDPAWKDSEEAKKTKAIGTLDVDVVRYVLAGVSSLDDKRPIDLIRISPNDTNNIHLIGGKPAPNQTAAGYKLAGDGLGHLIGFLEERWRRNDYVWGRLDAAELLLRALRIYAQREANAKGVDTAFTEAEYERILAKVQTDILQQEAKRFDGRVGIGTNSDEKIVPSLCGVPKRSSSPEEIDRVQRENRKIIGFGTEGVGNAVEPQFSQNLEYVATTLTKLFRGPSGKAPAVLDRFARASRIGSYASLALTWIFPLKPRTSRAIYIRLVAVSILLALLFGWGFSAGKGWSPVQMMLFMGQILIAALVLVALGAGLGYRFGYALLLMLAAGIGLQAMLEKMFPDASVMGYQTSSVAAMSILVIAGFIGLFGFAQHLLIRSKKT